MRKLVIILMLAMLFQSAFAPDGSESNGAQQEPIVPDEPDPTDPATINMNNVQDLNPEECLLYLHTLGTDLDPLNPVHQEAIGNRMAAEEFDPQNNDIDAEVTHSVLGQQTPEKNAETLNEAKKKQKSKSGVKKKQKTPIAKIAESLGAKTGEMVGDVTGFDSQGMVIKTPTAVISLTEFGKENSKFEIGINEPGEIGLMDGDRTFKITGTVTPKGEDTLRVDEKNVLIVSSDKCDPYNRGKSCEFTISGADVSSWSAVLVQPISKDNKAAVSFNGLTYTLPKKCIACVVQIDQDSMAITTASPIKLPSRNPLILWNTLILGGFRVEQNRGVVQPDSVFQYQLSGKDGQEGGTVEITTASKSTWKVYREIDNGKEKGGDLRIETKKVPKFEDPSNSYNKNIVIGEDGQPQYIDQTFLNLYRPMDEEQEVRVRLSPNIGNSVDEIRADFQLWDPETRERRSDEAAELKKKNEDSKERIRKIDEDNEQASLPVAAEFGPNWRYFHPAYFKGFFEKKELDDQEFERRLLLQGVMETIEKQDKQKKELEERIRQNEREIEQLLSDPVQREVKRTKTDGYGKIVFDPEGKPVEETVDVVLRRGQLVFEGDGGAELSNQGLRGDPAKIFHNVKFKQDIDLIELNLIPGKTTLDGSVIIIEPGIKSISADITPEGRFKTCFDMIESEHCRKSGIFGAVSVKYVANMIRNTPMFEDLPATITVFGDNRKFEKKCGSKAGACAKSAEISLLPAHSPQTVAHELGHVLNLKRPEVVRQFLSIFDDIEKVVSYDINDYLTLSEKETKRSPACPSLYACVYQNHEHWRGCWPGLPCVPTDYIQKQVPPTQEKQEEWEASCTLANGCKKMVYKSERTYMVRQNPTNPEEEELWKTECTLNNDCLKTVTEKTPGWDVDLQIPKNELQKKEWGASCTLENGCLKVVKGYREFGAEFFAEWIGVGISAEKGDQEALNDLKKYVKKGGETKKAISFLCLGGLSQMCTAGDCQPLLSKKICKAVGVSGGY